VKPLNFGLATAWRKTTIDMHCTPLYTQLCSTSEHVKKEGREQEGEEEEE